MIKKLNPKHLERLLNNRCDVKLYQEGLSEEGEPLTSLNLENQKCRFVEKTKTVITVDGQKVELVGKVILLGDIAPNIIDRNFNTTKPYEKAGTDVSVFITQYGKLYLSPIIDFHTREVFETSPIFLPK